MTKIKPEHRVTAEVEETSFLLRRLFPCEFSTSGTSSPSSSMDASTSLITVMLNGMVVVHCSTHMDLP
ncbi:hypothetical protein ACIPSK_12185 [Rhizobium sp. LARHSG275]|uniref:hypothetical protein n=1 Tax=Rhizobium TaxID=379 RepID=UPI001389DFB9|nr:MULTISPECIES: hypothetical protein [Rhizobium]NDK49702.1 hypothetical protein [Rhizobium laguerreae]UWM74245.1 hypothetical protein N1937_16175 [Rhizobium leguminosarum bv. viciae]